MKRYLLPTSVATSIVLAIAGLARRGAAALRWIEDARSRQRRDPLFDRDREGVLASERLELLTGGKNRSRGAETALVMDADFEIDVMYTDWSAPGKIDNADNPLLLSKSDFTSFQPRAARGKSEGARSHCAGEDQPIELRVTYRLEPRLLCQAKRRGPRQGVRSPFSPVVLAAHGAVEGVTSVVKEGGFGQPRRGAIGKRRGRSSASNTRSREPHRANRNKFQSELAVEEKTNRVAPATGGAAEPRTTRVFIYELHCGQEYGALVWERLDLERLGRRRSFPTAPSSKCFLITRPRARRATPPLLALQHLVRSSLAGGPEVSADRVMSEKTCSRGARSRREKKTHGVEFDTSFSTTDGTCTTGLGDREEQWPKRFQTRSPTRSLKWGRPSRMVRTHWRYSFHTGA